MTVSLQQLSTLAQAVAYEALWSGPGDQRSHQRRLEKELFTHCDGIGPSEVGLHWCFDWLFAPGQSLSSAIGRIFGHNNQYAQLALKHQSTDRGIVCEVRLPIESYDFDDDTGVLVVTYQGEADVRIYRLQSGEQESRTHWVDLSLRKEINTADRPWTSEGSLLVLDSVGGQEILSWSWDYHFTSIADRPDYNLDSLLDLLSADAIPGGIGHLIPTLSGDVEGAFTYEDSGTTYGSSALQGGYTDGNFSRTSTENVDRLIHDHWGWLAIPRLWSLDGVPVEHMFMAGFFKAPLFPELFGDWSGVVLWRNDPDEISSFRLSTLLTKVEVRHHNARYLDMTMITDDWRYRLTFRIWSQPLVSKFVPPGSNAFRDHQDLLASGYVVIEQNVAPWPIHRFFPRWRAFERLVTNMAGCEFGERERVIGSPDYPAYRAVPDKPKWLRQALGRIPETSLTQQFPAYRLNLIQPPT